MALSSIETLAALELETDGVSTHSSNEQRKVEESVSAIYRSLKGKPERISSIRLFRDRHASYLLKGLKNLSENYECLDASRPWLCYWILHSLCLLDVPVYEHMELSVIDFLKRCQARDGGFGGGPGQLAHLAPTYAAVLALCTIGTEEAYNAIDRKSLQNYLLSMHTDEGAFMMHHDGELDVRGAYCALVCALLTNTATEAMFKGTAEWIVSCQTYEGGIAGEPGLEAHGGYTFCGLAALLLLGKVDSIDIDRLVKWAVHRQMKFEGGFQGRTNKLVDGCYSFWQGGLFPVIAHTLQALGCKAIAQEDWMFDREALQHYILFCCQSLIGGLVDKPGKTRDFYHTCYCLSGLSMAQKSPGDMPDVVIGGESNLLKPTHPLFNIRLDKEREAKEFFRDN
ncbi:protein farnesyltransferase subunit beta-like [Oscarella lobularis]|uniref:protein farnesyltransferase subunit beta-like n=1 Tax=Oscarella lobularis TaxID=121494 RepID=UPI003313EAB0